MCAIRTRTSSTHAQHKASLPPSMRIAAVAQMAGMPVATLRIWEQRYQIVQAAATPAKHRLYSPADAKRVMLLRQLTQQGHAISSIAGLDSLQLEQLSATAGGDSEMMLVDAESLGAKRTMRIVIIGQVMALRLQRPAAAQRVGLVARISSVFESIEEAMQVATGQSADLIIWHLPDLHLNTSAAVAEQLRAVQQSLGAQRAAVIYRYAGSAATRKLAHADLLSLREPADDEALIAWLMSVQAAMQLPQGTVDQASPANNPQSVAHAPTPRRFDDAALTALAGLAPKLACECPQHIAQLLMQLSSFESYSAGCVNQSPEDAQLHVYLQQVAGASRAMFESALERVAKYEGLKLG